MKLIDNNINIIKEFNPNLWKNLKNYQEKAPEDPFAVVDAKNGLPTLIFNGQGGAQYLHSKYDPVNEAQRFVEQFDGDEVAQYEHILFYGVGLGYHIDAFLARFAQIPYTLYEPEPAVFYHFLAQKSLKELPLKQINQIYVEFKAGDAKKIARHFINFNQSKVLLVILPSYERIFNDKSASFAEHFRQTARDKRSAIHVNLDYEKLWTINSLINFHEVIKTPNILHHIDKSNFQGKPALIVAAGPSLEEEIENIRYIKENGLAYVFSIGSAVNALLAYDIYPDAVCAYDPKEANLMVFEKVIKGNISSIPLIFGSSVGYKLLQKFPGPKIHMITSQDTVAPYYLRLGEQDILKQVSDATTIAVLALNILLELECDPIILVGQNLAYRDNQHYSKSISYSHRPTAMTAVDKKNMVEVEDVYGNKVGSKRGWIQSCRQMEKYIQYYSTIRKVNVINCTSGGAKINGTVFKPLEETIQNNLGEKIVDPGWASAGNNYDLNYLEKRVKTMELEYKDYLKVEHQMVKALVEIEKQAKHGNEQALQHSYKKFDNSLKKFRKNNYYKVFLEPMNRVQLELAIKNVATVRFETDAAKKAEKVVGSYGKFVQECQRDVQVINSVLPQISQLALQHTITAVQAN